MRNIIVIGDTHIGCRYGLCPDSPIVLDGGVQYVPSNPQKLIWSWWREFHEEWVPRVTRGEPYIVVHMGDAIEGIHHGAVTQVSHNIADQTKMARLVLAPIVEKAQAFYMLRGTEAHAGPSAQQEELLGVSLGAAKDNDGFYTRQELWLQVGSILAHFAHCIGTTSSGFYETTAVMKELVESYLERGRWGERVPSVIARAHRHRQCEVRMASEHGYCIAFVNPGWQLPTPWLYRQALGRVSSTQVGGYLIRCGDEDEVYTRFSVKTITKPQPHVYEV